MLRSLQLVLSSSLCVLLLTSCCCDPLMDSEAIIRPTRPKNFASPDDLRDYLQQLSQYYAVVGRPRFGKRTALGKSRHLIPGFVYPQNLDSTDIFEILQYYQPQQQE